VAGNTHLVSAIAILAIIIVVIKLASSG
jgi:hypothetical protein